MNEKLEALKASISASLQRTRVFYSSHRTLLLSGLTVLSILLIVWARMGFTLDFNRFYAYECQSDEDCETGEICDENRQCVPDPSAPAPGTICNDVGGQCDSTCVPPSVTRGRQDCPISNAICCGPPESNPVPGTFTGPGGKPTPAELREWARTEGWSEDFVRFSNAVLQNWIDNWWNIDERKFNSSRGETGLFEKPTECNPGRVPSGPNEDDPCMDLPADNSPSPTATATNTNCPTRPTTSTPAVLGVTCGTTQNVLSWQNPRTLNASVNTVLRGVNGGDGALIFTEGGCWNTFAISTYTDANVQAGNVYTYRIKTSNLAVSNTVTCGATPTPTTSTTVTPTPTTSTTVTPTPVYPLLACAPINQTVALNQIASVAATGGSGAYQWELSGSGVQQGGTATSVSVSYSVSGQKVVRVSSAGQIANCVVTVSDTTTTITPTPIPVCSATAPPGAWASNITGTSAVLSWTPGTGGSYQQLRVGSNQAEVNSGCQSNPTSCVVAQHTLPLSTSTYTITNLLTPGTTYYWRVVNLQAGPPVCYRDIATQFTTTTTTSTGGVPGTVQTGPGDAVFAALLMSAIMTLLYVSYTHTSAYKRKEIETITKDRDPMDFRS